MEGLLLLLLPVVLLTIVVLFAWMVADVAILGGDRKVEAKEKIARAWQPPYIGGEALLSWARETASDAVGRMLRQDADASSVTDLTRELQDGATRAMLPQLRDRELARSLACPAGGQGEIGVTAAEAIAIAERIRATMSRRDQTRILRRATAIAAARPVGESTSNGRRPPPCALQGEDCHCMTYPDRPLRCRPFHAGALLARLELSTRVVPDAETGTMHSRIVAEGVEDGLVKGLDSVGLDRDLYELNAALSIALGTPDAARRWLDGEALFSTCAPAFASA